MSRTQPIKKAILISVVLLLLTLAFGGTVVSRSQETGATYDSLRLFTEVLSIVQSQYVEEVAPKELIYDAIKGTLRGLDPHSSFLDPDMYREMQVETSGSFGGLGIEITLRDDVLTVVAPIEGTPAYRAGLLPGDRIVKIEGIATKDMQLFDAVKRMRGRPGTKITISVLRDGWMEPKDFTIIREQIHVQSVRSQELEAGIGYIRLRQFQEQTGDDLEAALEKLSADAELQGLVLDLRSNPGGLLTAAVEVAEQFLETGKLVVYTEGRVRNQNMRFTANSRDSDTDVPLVVLVNKGSASASEIVAGALQDWNRAVILGTETFGKGSVQTIIPLSDGAGLRLTTAKYFTPKGRSIHGEGIMPDIVVERTRIIGAAELSRATVEQSAEERVKKDPQLDRAVDLLKAMRILEKGRPESTTPPRAQLN
ncbi:MAG: S41 family peptidase [Candidatus Methylomirabilia bacterium]